MLDQCDVIARAYVRWRRPASARGVVCSRSRRRRRARPYPVGPCRRGRRRRVRVRVRAAHGRGHETRGAGRATECGRRRAARARGLSPAGGGASRGRGRRAGTSRAARRASKRERPDLPGRRRRHARRARAAAFATCTRGEGGVVDPGRRRDGVCQVLPSSLLDGERFRLGRRPFCTVAGGRGCVRSRAGRGVRRTPGWRGCHGLVKALSLWNPP